MTKERLREYRALNIEIRKLESELLEIEARASKITPLLTFDPVGTNKAHDTMAEAVASIVDQQRRINSLLERVYQQRDAIELAIEKMPSTSRTLLRMRYISCLGWEEICVEMGYCWRQIHYLHSEALKEING